jgi:hypothetical protein
VVTDVALSPFEANASLIVTAGGSAHKIHVAQQGLSMCVCCSYITLQSFIMIFILCSLLYMRRDPLVPDPSNLSGFEQEGTFWRIAWGDSQSSAFLAGEHCVKHLDLRVCTNISTKILVLLLSCRTTATTVVRNRYSSSRFNRSSCFHNCYSKCTSGPESAPPLCHCYRSCCMDRYSISSAVRLDLATQTGCRSHPQGNNSEYRRWYARCPILTAMSLKPV